MNKGFAFVLAMAAFLVLDSRAALALQVLSGHITVLESTYMPTSISFQLDVGNTACPPGKWLKWTSAPSMQATYSAMLAALLSGRKVNFFINDNDATCTGQFFHVTSDL